MIELASFSRFSETHQSFLDQLTESIGIVLNTIAANMRTEGLLKQSQLLTGELQSQQEELKKTNERLEQQAATLRQSEELLRQQQDKLADHERGAGGEGAPARDPEAGGRDQEPRGLARQDGARGEGRAALADLALQVAVPGQHEPRAAHAAELAADPVEAPDREPGRQPLGQAARVREDDPRGGLGPSRAHQRHPRPLEDRVRHGQPGGRRGRLPRPRRAHGAHLPADRRGARASTSWSRSTGALPPAMRTDAKRLQQVLRNLLSNAFKFTEEGGVTLRIGSAEGSPLRAGVDWIALSVTDTGIGIPEDKQRIIFEAFQQADGTTSRKYGGTGLGLAISREIARLLGGEIVVSSQPGRGSTFTLFLPIEPPATTAAAFRTAYAAGRQRLGHGPVRPRRRWRCRPPPTTGTPSRPGDHVVLIVEDDAMFASVLLELAREQGFKGLIAGDGATALALAHRYKPHAITLDLGLPDMDGWALLDLLKHDPRTRHVPIHVISVDDAAQARHAGRRLRLPREAGRPRRADGGPRPGRKEFIDRPVKNLLLVEDDDGQRLAHRRASRATARCEVTAVGTAEAALEAIADAALRLRHRRPRPAGPARRRADRAHPQGRRRRSICRSSSIPARISARTRSVGSSRSPRPSSSRTRIPPRSSSTRRRCSCIAPSPGSRRRGRSSSSARTTRRSTAARCSSSTTTCATSSR